MIRYLRHERVKSNTFCNNPAVFWKVFVPNILQKLSFEGVLSERCSEIWSIFTGEHARSSVVSINLLCNFIEITLGHRCFPVDFLYHIRILLLRTPLDDCFEFWEIRKKHPWWSLILIDWQTETLLKFNFTDE